MKLAKEMNDIILDPQRYFDFFKWHGYYSFHATANDKYRQTVCELCAFLNSYRRKNLRKAYKDIDKWWNVQPPTHIVAVRSISDMLPGFVSNFIANTSAVPPVTVEEKPSYITSLIGDVLQSLFD